MTRSDNVPTYRIGLGYCLACKGTIRVFQMHVGGETFPLQQPFSIDALPTIICFPKHAQYVGVRYELIGSVERGQRIISVAILNVERVVSAELVQTMAASF